MNDALDAHPIAWVESPLQAIGAAEAAAALGRPVELAFRLTGPQMPATVAELRRRGAPFEAVEPYAGIPWSRLAQHRHWIVGDVFSGQFRAALAVLPPRRLTLVDDGDMTLHFAEVFGGDAEFGRRGRRESAVARLLGVAAHSRLLALAGRDRLELRTAFADDPRVAALTGAGVEVRSNRFDWLRRHAEPLELPSHRVVLGTALVTDGRLPVPGYLAWVRRTVAGGEIAYLPHRREAADLVRRVAAIPGVTVLESGLPVELALAGTTEPLDVVAYRSTAATTLQLVLAGSGSRIRAVVGEDRG